MRIQTRSSSYRCNFRIINHLALKKGQNVIFESKTTTPHIMGLINHLEMKNGQKVIFEKQEQNPPYKTHIRKETEKIRIKERHLKSKT